MLSLRLLRSVLTSRSYQIAFDAETQSWLSTIAASCQGCSKNNILLRSYSREDEFHQGLARMHSQSIAKRMLSKQAEKDETVSSHESADERKKSSKPFSYREMPSGEIIKNLGRYLWPKDNTELKLRFAASVFLVLAGRVLNVQVPFVFKSVVDALSIDPTGSVPIFHVLTVAPATIVLGYGLIRTSAAFCSELRALLFSVVQQRAVRTIVHEVFINLHAQDLKFHLERQTGALARVMDRGLRGITFILGNMAFSVLPTVFEVALVGSILGSRCGSAFAVLTFGTIAAYTVFTFSVTQWRMRFRRAMNEADQNTMASAVDSLINWETVKSCQAEEHEARRHDSQLADYEIAAVKTYKSLALLGFGQNVILSSAIAAAMYLAVHGVVDGRLTIGDVVMVNGLLFQLTSPLNFLGTVYRETKQSLVDMGAMFNLLEMRPKIKEKPDATVLPPTKQGYDIKFQNVRFGYTTKISILKDVSFSIPAGSTCAIVGTSGSGKSTLLRLLYRFFEVKEGSVRIAGIDVRDLKFNSLRSAIGQVPQDTVLFNESIFYNIHYGRLDASVEEVHAAAKAARIHESILKMPKGYDTRVGERGLKLSGGEKQRVAIARVFLQAPQILLFDEATSALDTVTERDILEAFERLAKGRTAIFVAHRLSTAAQCDHIVVLENGRVLESGSHAELLKKGGKYYQLWMESISSGEEENEQTQVN